MNRDDIKKALEDTEKVSKELGIPKGKVKSAKQSRLDNMDYAQEYLTLFFILGVFFVVISIAQIALSFWAKAGFFVVLVILAFFFPPKAFVWLGHPVAVVRSFLYRDKKQSKTD